MQRYIKILKCEFLIEINLFVYIDNLHSIITLRNKHQKESTHYKMHIHKRVHEGRQTRPMIHTYPF